MDAPDNPKQQLAERLKAANNVLVTVSRNPSVDQLAACIGLTLVLNKMGKHATAVFSGEVPSTLEFLQPESTLEKNTDSLRDFIISLDKSKADKLRYKVEDTVVKIFITPYRTSLSANDLEFSQGDFNVDVVVALGVHEQEDLDNAITGHGRILHDATIATVNTTDDGDLGGINWRDTQASSLCELVVDLVRDLGKDLVDSQIATALLTGVVAETQRFSNEKTTPQTMSVSAELMNQGANQQLVATKLDGPSVNLRGSSPDAGQAQQNSTTPPAADDGTLEINHPHDNGHDVEPPSGPQLPPPTDSGEPLPELHSDDTSRLANRDKTPRFITEPPTLGGTLTANSTPEQYEPGVSALNLPPVDSSGPILSHGTPGGEPAAPASPAPEPQPAPTPMQPAPDNWVPPVPGEPSPPPVPPAPAQETTPPPPPPPAPAPEPPLPPAPKIDDSKKFETLSDLEKEVHSPHVEPPQADQNPDLDAARSEVMNALNSAPLTPEPIQALNAQPVDLGTPPPSDQPAPPPPPSTEFDPAAFGLGNDGDVPGGVPVPTLPLPPNPASAMNPAQPAPQVFDPSVPPVPPPLFPPPAP